MFTEQLSYISESKSLKSSNVQTACLENGMNKQRDLQYQIYGTFLKQTGQKLSSRQSELMERSRQFIDRYASFKKKQMDSSRTLDTLLEDLTEPSLSLQEDRSLTLNRRGSSPFGSRKSIQLVGDQLAQIQERCSLTCFNFFNSLVAEYKRLENKMRQAEAKETGISRREEFIQKIHSENIILKKRLQHQQEKIEALQSEISLLREKNKSINSCINERINSLSNSHKYFEINHKVYRDIKNYVQQKESLLKKQSECIANTETSVLQAIEQAFQKDSCGKCCQILKKLKESIMKFKRYLQGESQQFQKLYDKYKKTMYTVRSRPSV